MEHVKAPRTAVVWSVLSAELAALSGDDRHELAIVDVGGGTGGFAVPLASAGHRVTVVDTSPNALAGLTRRASEAGVADRIAAVQGDADELVKLVDAHSAHLVLCHSVLEMVDSPQAVLDAIAAVVRPGGAVSLLVANRAAAVLSRAYSGNLAEATAILTDVNGRAGEHDPLQRRFDPTTLVALVDGSGLVAEQVHGIQVVSDLVPGAVRDSDPGAVGALRDFEMATAARVPFRDIATQLHLLARRPLR